MRHLKILSITLGVVLALGTASCLEEEKQPETKADTGTANTPDTGGTVNTPDTGGTVNTPDTGTVNKGDTGASGPNEKTDELCSDGIDNDNNGYTDCADFSCCRYGVPATGITVCPAGTCGGGSKGDAGTSTRPDTGVVKPTLTEVTATVKDIRTKTDTYTTDLSKYPATAKAIVLIKDVVVVGAYPHSAGDVDLYIQDAAGGAQTGMNVNYFPASGAAVPAVGAKITVRGCVKNNYGAMSIMKCDDDQDTKATVTDSGATLPIPTIDAYPAAELAQASTSHDDHLGQLIKVSNELTLSEKPAECVGNGNTYCGIFTNGTDQVFVKFSFTYKCDVVKNSAVGMKLAALEGVWDEVLRTGNTKVHSVIPMACDAVK